MIKIIKSFLVVSGVLVFQSLTTGTAYGADAQPQDFVPAPAGTQLGLLYYIGSTSHTFIDGNGNKVPGSSLNVNTGLLRYVYYFNVAGMRADVNVLQPFGGLNDMKIAGTKVDTQNFSLGDVTLIGTIWPLNEPENGLYLGFANYLTMPTGNYSSSKPGLASNQWSYAFQPAFLFNITPKWSVELAGDVTIFSNNGNGPGGASVKKDPSYTSLGWLNYQASAKTMLSVGYWTNWGGAETVGGVKGADVKSTTVRAAWSQMLNPSTQFLIQVGHDVSAQNAFQRETTLMFRLAKFF